jgi:uncharacterized protein (TIGR00299 family) protein
VSTLVLEPIGGIAGDMTIAALLHLGAPPAVLEDGLRRLGLPGVSVQAHDVEVSGMRALFLEVRAPREEHVHRRWREIRELISSAKLPARATELAQSAFALLAKAEARIHGVDPEEVEFHEIGSIDSIVDLVGAALLIDAVGPRRIVALPPPSGGGTAKTAHGVIPLPAPATVELLRGRTIRPSGTGERTTPTGAAILAAWTEEAAAVPEITIDRIGYGAGTRRWEDAPNVVRALLGRQPAPDREAAWVLETNLDDLSPQLVAAALDSVLQAGALDAWVAPVTMKKGRPAHLFGALVPDAARAGVEAEIFKQTSTLGIRATRVERRVLDRVFVEVETAYGKVRIKIGRLAGAVVNVAPEFEDCRQAAERHGVPLKEVLAAALSAFRLTR